MNEKEQLQNTLPFNKPLTSRYRKKYVESISLNLLKYCYGNTYSEFYVDDAPDIQNKDKSIGIEVVEAITYEEAQIEGEFTKYRLQSNPRDEERSKQLIERNGAKIEEFGLSYPLKDSTGEILSFQCALRKKMGKLASYKSHGFDKLGVFIFYNESLIPIKLEDLKKYIDNVLNEYSDKYDFIYLGYSCGLIYYDILTGNIQINTIERTDYNQLQYETRQKVETIK